MASPVKAPTFGRNTFPNNVGMKERTDLNLSEVVYVSITRI